RHPVAGRHAGRGLPPARAALRPAAPGANHRAARGGRSLDRLQPGLHAPEDRAAGRASLLTVVLADGINLGLRRMAEACQGVSVWQLARVVDWHVREDTYALATARLVEAQRQSPLARLWGDGTRSSSGGQLFHAGGSG